MVFLETDSMYVPSGVLEDAKRAEEARTWARSQRESVAAMWAENARRQAEGLLGGLGEALGGLGEGVARATQAAAAGIDRERANAVAGGVAEELYQVPVVGGIARVAADQLRSSIAGQMINPYPDQEAIALARDDPMARPFLETGIEEARARGAEPSVQEMGRMARGALAGPGLVLGMAGEPLGKAGAAGRAAQAAESVATPAEVRTVTPFGRVEAGAEAEAPLAEAAAVPRPSISRAETARRAEAFEISPAMIDEIARQPEGEKAVVLTRLRQQAAGLWEERARIMTEMDEGLKAAQVGQDELASLAIKQGMLRQAERAAIATTEAAKREASETGRALNSMLIAVNGKLAGNLAGHYEQVQQATTELVREVASAARAGRAISRDGRRNMQALKSYLAREAEGTAVPRVAFEQAPQTATEATVRGRQAARAGRRLPEAAKRAADEAVPEPELREFLDLLYKQGSASERGDTAAVRQVQGRMDELMDGFLERARRARAGAEPAGQAAREPMAPEDFDRLVMEGIRRRVQAVVDREVPKEPNVERKAIRTLVDKAFGFEFNTAAEQRLAARASQQIEDELNRTFGKAWQRAVGEHVTTLVRKLKGGGYPEEIDFARAESAIDEMVRQRPDLAQAADRLRERIRKAEAQSAFSQVGEVRAAEEAAIRGTARETLSLLDRFERAAPGAPEYRQYANEVLMGLSRLGTAAKAEARRHRVLANKQAVRGLLSKEERALSPEEQAARIDELANQLVRFTDEDWAEPHTAALFAAAVTREGAFEKVHRWRIASMLSGIPTMLLNLGGSAVETALAPGVRLIAGVAERVSPVQRGAVNATERMALDEIEGFAAGHRAALGEFLKTWEMGVSGRPRPDLHFGVRLSNKNPAHLPLLVLQATDDYWYTANFSAALRAEMRRESIRTGKSMEEIRLDLIHHPDVVDRAAEQASRRTYTQTLGQISKAINTLRDNPIGKTVQPFFNTIAAMAEIGAERSILPGSSGFAQAGKFARQGDYARAADRRAEGLLGAGIMAAAGTLAAAGNITGYGPTDPKKRADWLDQGNQPYSVRLGDKWVSYANSGSLIIPLGLAASAVEAVREGAEERSVTAGLMHAVKSFGALWLDVNALRGVTDALNAMTDPQRYADRFLESLAISYTSPGFLSSLARVFDPEQKDPEGLVEMWLSRMPGLSRRIKPALTQTGEPVTRQTGLGALLPFRTKTVSPSPVLQEFERLRDQGQDVALGRAGGEIEGVRLSPDEAYEYQQRAGRLSAALVRAAMADPVYSKLPAAMQAERVTKARDRARELARLVVSAKAGPRFEARKVQARYGLDGR